MGRIQTSVGLASGIDIGDLVDQLMALNAKPRDLLQTRTDTYKSEQTAIQELAALLLATEYVATNLGKDDLFDTRTATSSNSSAVSATVTGTPPEGSYQYTPVRTVQSQQFLSSGLRSSSEAIGEGTFSFRFGDNVERSVDLSLFGGGEGVSRGKIRITDRSGASTQIDLSTVQTVDDVLEAINSATSINVTAVANGDCIRLVDNTGLTTSNLMVQEVGGGTTAASLGLAGINVAASVADGEDMIELSRDVDIDALNDGNGVSVSTSLADISYHLRDGTEGTIDLSPIIPGGSTVDKEMTLGEVMDVVNAAAPDKLRVEVFEDGDRLVIKDLTTGSDEFTLGALYDSGALQDLGLDGSAVDGVITGRRVLGGVKTVLLSSLNGGNGYGSLGVVEITDRSGASDTVDLSGAKTLQDVVDLLNTAEVGVTASINAAQNGIVLEDTTGASTSNLIVADMDATNTATKLGIVADSEEDTVGSGDMHLQVVSYNTLLSEFNGGEGVPKGSIVITDSTGNKQTIELKKDTIETIGDVMDAINRSGLSVRAEINETGDGIWIRDTGGGDGQLQIAESGSTGTAAALHILGTAEDVEIDGEMTQVIDGSTTYTVVIEADDTLEDLCEKINDLGAGVRAAIFDDGSSKPYRLSLASEHAGEVGSLVIDSSEVGLSFQETVEARDALLVYGSLSSGGENILVSSSSNNFVNVLPGVTLTVKSASSAPVTISITTSDTSLVTNIKTMITNYNKFRDQLTGYTAYDSDSGTKSVLTGDSAALRLDTELSALLSQRIYGAGSIRSLAELGITLNDDGTLVLDEDKLSQKYAEDPDAVKEFFTAEDTGFSARFCALAEQLAGTDSSLLMQRYSTLDDKIAENEDRITFMNERLEAQRERLTNSFYQMEIAISKMQSEMSVIEAMASSASSFYSSTSSNSSN